MSKSSEVWQLLFLLLDSHIPDDIFIKDFAVILIFDSNAIIVKKNGNLSAAIDRKTLKIANDVNKLHSFASRLEFKLNHKKEILVVLFKSALDSCHILTIIINDRISIIVKSLFAIADDAQPLSAMSIEISELIEDFRQRVFFEFKLHDVYSCWLVDGFIISKCSGYGNSE